MRLALGDDPRAKVGQLVHDPADGDFVAGDDARGEDDGVALAQLEFVRCPTAIRPSAARGSPWPPVAMISTSLRGRRIASSKSIGGGKSWRYPVAWATRRIRSSERPAMHTLRPVSIADAADRLQPRRVGGEGRDQHAALGLGDLGEQAGMDAFLGARRLVLEDVGRIAHQREDALDRRSRVSVSGLGASPSTGVSSIFQSPVWKTLPNGVSIRTPLPSGIECDSATKLTRNGPSSIASATLDDVELDLRRSAPPPRACRRSGRR